MKTMSSIQSQQLQRGAVSIFVVIFAALLITIVTVSFIRVMVNDQNQASNNDLSQSAFDSAQAGVEDAKRALLRYVSVCESGSAACSQLATHLATDECNAAVRIGNVVGTDSEGPTSEGTGEIRIQQSTSTNDEQLDQAYTCTTIELDTVDYVGSLTANESKLVPLIAENPDGTSTFDRVTIQWFSRDDLGASASAELDVVAPTTPSPLLDDSEWPSTRPPLLRVGFMQFGDNFTLEQFDYTAGGESNANTVFLYPTLSQVANQPITLTQRDPRAGSPGGVTPADSSGNSPTSAQCTADLSAGGFACSTTIILPEPHGGGERTAFLRLTPFFNATSFRVTMGNGSEAVVFDGVQPAIDSTGRANDVFRRVVSRVDLIDTSFPYPEAALDISGDICKNFAVTSTQYQDLGCN
jgi:Tfp pilus assembly protein PilX